MVFHFDKSGNEVNELHPEKIKLISIILEVFHIDISGILSNESQQKNKPFKDLTSEISHFVISGTNIIEIHPKNICSKLEILLNLNDDLDNIGKSI